jgi:hypothetical protein
MCRVATSILGLRCMVDFHCEQDGGWATMLERDMSRTTYYEFSDLVGVHRTLRWMLN